MRRLLMAALMCSSKWDGGYDTITNAEVPVYFVIGDSDEYYWAEPFRQAYREIRERYEEKHLSEAEISELVRLAVWGTSKAESFRQYRIMKGRIRQ